MPVLAFLLPTACQKEAEATSPCHLPPFIVDLTSTIVIIIITITNKIRSIKL